MEIAELTQPEHRPTIRAQRTTAFSIPERSDTRPRQTSPPKMLTLTSPAQRTARQPLRSHGPCRQQTFPLKKECLRDVHPRVYATKRRASLAPVLPPEPATRS